MLECVERSLKSGGRLLFQMAGKGNAEILYEAFDEVIATENYRGYFEGFTFPYTYPTPQEYELLLLQADLEPIRIDLTDNEMKFHDIAGLTGSIRTTWLPYTERVPISHRDGFIRDVVKAYLQRHPPRGGGSICIDMKRLEVEAKKP